MNNGKRRTTVHFRTHRYYNSHFVQQASQFTTKNAGSRDNGVILLGGTLVVFRRAIGHPLAHDSNGRLLIVHVEESLLHTARGPCTRGYPSRSRGPQEDAGCGGSRDPQAGHEHRLLMGSVAEVGPRPRAEC